MLTKEAIVLAISGPSGVGKGTIIKAVREKMPDSYLSISCTSRPPRGEEENGRDYYFVSREEFETMIRDGAILEYDKFVEEYYGTPLGPLKDNLAQQKDIILDITVKGALSIKDKLPDAVTVFLVPPSLKVLEERLRERGTESEDKIKKRLAYAKDELEMAKTFDYIVCNNNLEQCIAKVEAIIQAERCSSQRQGKIVDYLLTE